MATTVREVFDIAMSLMDEVDERSGNTDTSDTREYKQRTVLILNSVLNTLYPYSDTYVISEKGKRPICPMLTDRKDLTDVIGLDDGLCRDVLPYYLGAMLLMDENPSTANTLLQIYEERLQAMKSMPQCAEDIEDVYSGCGFPHNDFGRWS